MARARKTSTCEILKTSARGKYRFELSIYGPDGVRSRKFYLTKGEAERERDRCIKEWTAPEYSVELTPEERAAVLAARKANLDLGQLVAAAAKSQTHAAASLPLREGVERWLAGLDKAGRSDRHRDGMRQFFVRVAEKWGNVPISDITPAMIGAYIHDRSDLSDSTRSSYRRIFRVFFSTALEHGWCPVSPVDKVKAPRGSSHSDEIAVLTPEQCRRLLTAVRDHSPALLPAVALSMFAGLRTAEMMRLDWSEVWLPRGLIVVTARKAKTSSRRMVTVQQPLAALLAGHEPAQTPGPDGKPLPRPVWPANGRRLWDRATKAAGWRGEIHMPPPPDPGAPEWPSNALRHSFVSYHVAWFRNPAETAMEAGHSVDILHRHYRELASQDEAAEFWTAGFLE